METILRQGIFRLQYIEGTSFLNLSDLLRAGTEESKKMKELLLQVVRCGSPVRRAGQFNLYDNHGAKCLRQRKEIHQSW